MKYRWNRETMGRQVGDVDELTEEMEPRLRMLVSSGLVTPLDKEAKPRTPRRGRRGQEDKDA